MEQRLSSLKVEDLRTTNAGMTRCISLAKLAANSDVPIVLLGETGTGKTLLAQAIHNSSARAEGPFVQCLGHERYVARESALWSRKRCVHWGATSRER